MQRQELVVRAPYRLLLSTCLIAAPLHAQSTAHTHDGMAGMERTSTVVSAAAQREVDRVAKALLPLAAANAAQSAGFQPVLGWIPTMGVHWVNQERMLGGSRFDMVAPSQLMFSKIDGRDSLVGAAYSYVAPVADTARPATFDGNPSWHEHADLAPAGMSLVMLHVWFVPSPDGPFAGTNPNLPFWALGLSAPDPERMRDSAFNARVRRAALALAEIADTRGVFPMLGRRPAVHAALAVQRDSVRALVPELREAMMSKDTARLDRVVERTAAQWDAMYAIYSANASSAASKKRLVDYTAMLMGQHSEHSH